MEPNDLTPTPEDARLGALLRQNGISTVPDNGFSAAVLSALPPPRRRLANSRTLDLIAAGAAVVVVLAIQLAQNGPVGTFSSLAEALNEFSTLFTGRTVAITMAVLIGALAFLEDPEAPELL